MRGSRKNGSRILVGERREAGSGERCYMQRRCPEHDPNVSGALEKALGISVSLASITHWCIKRLFSKLQSVASLPLSCIGPPSSIVSLP